MKTIWQKRSMGGYILGVLGIVCLLLSISISFPYESRGGAHLEELKIYDEDIPPLLQVPLKFETIYIKAEISHLKVYEYEGYYIGEARLEITNDEQVGLHSLTAIIPYARIQRVFEVAMGRKLEVHAWGYKMPPLDEYGTYYRITSASVIDPDVPITAVAAPLPEN